MARDDGSGEYLAVFSLDESGEFDCCVELVKFERLPDEILDLLRLLVLALLMHGGN